MDLSSLYSNIWHESAMAAVCERPATPSLSGLHQTAVYWCEPMAIMYRDFELPVEDDATLEKRFLRVFGRKMTPEEREWLFMQASFGTDHSQKRKMDQR